MVKYKFPVKEQTARTSGIILKIRNFEAEVDEANTVLMTLVKSLSGAKVPIENKSIKRGKK